MSKKHDKDFLMSRKYATFVANEYAKRIEKAIERLNIIDFDNFVYTKRGLKDIKRDLLNILQGEKK